ncbi:acyl-CoA synthetase [Parahaliea mediterranea]|uniref:Acyl-CoA synthetase n=1 Tax=Parahaliea mediterranea TaxID=651086 RepID=A0A939DE42_9GAMM|nr:acyl-CoA synthetase [Parahaliea mediterranea]MBN7796211.1 acyl-CoA synthetase [Parahaliea mediterranea]
MSVACLGDIVAIEQAQPNPFGRFDNTYEMICAGAAIAPNATALSFVPKVESHFRPAVWTYGQWRAEITRAANMLRRLGLQENEVVAYVLPNLPETHLAIWGGETAGIVFAVNTQLDGAQMAQLLQAADTRWLITLGPEPEPEIWNRVSGAMAAMEVSSLRGILAVNPLHHSAGGCGNAGAECAQSGLPTQLHGVPVLDFHLELARESGDSLHFLPPRANDIASYFCTGGTTGLPKIATHSHGNEIANAIQLQAVFAQLYRPGKTFLACLPLFHVNAQLGSGLAVFGAGAQLLLGPPEGYRAAGLMDRFWEIVAHHRVATFSGVPTIFAGLLQSPREGMDLSCLDYAICGAAPMPLKLLDNFEQQTGMRVREGYGLTESTCVASLNPPGADARTGSIGLRLPWEKMRVVVLDEKGNFLREADTDEVGVVAISGPNVFAGYLEATHNTTAWIHFPGDTKRWLNTGDLARRDADGYFWLTGRKKELIIRGGHNIDPKVIEEALASHPDVAMSAAVGRPDAHAGEVPVAYVQLHVKGSVREEALMEYASEAISERAAIPKAIRLVDTLPVTAVGKIFKPALIFREVESVVRTEAESSGVTLASLSVAQESGVGIVARYAIANGDARALSSALAKYIFKSAVER